MLYPDGGFCCHINQFTDVIPYCFITALAGIALLGTIGHNITLAFQNTAEREAALLTFLFSASGVQFFGIGSAFWGLIFGFVVFCGFKHIQI